MEPADSISVANLASPTVPGWAIPRGSVASDVEAAFMAGSALNSLDNLVRSDPPWAGAWRLRLALKCAAAAATLAGRTEDEAQLRGVGWLHGFGDLMGGTREEARSGVPAPVVAAAMREDRQRHPVHKSGPTQIRFQPHLRPDLR